MENKKHLYKRISMTIGGLFLCGVSVGFLKLAVVVTETPLGFLNADIVHQCRCFKRQQRIAGQAFTNGNQARETVYFEKVLDTSWLAPVKGNHPAGQLVEHDGAFFRGSLATEQARCGTVQGDRDNRD